MIMIWHGCASAQLAGQGRDGFSARKAGQAMVRTLSGWKASIFRPPGGLCQEF